MVLFNTRTKKIRKKTIVHFLTKSLFSTDYHKTHKTQIGQILKMNTKLFFEENTMWHTHFNIQRIKNHKKLIYCDLSANHSVLCKSQKTKKIKYLKSNNILTKCFVDKNFTQKVLFNSRTKKIKEKILLSTFWPNHCFLPNITKIIKHRFFKDLK